jgi:hypothetical protein
MEGHVKTLFARLKEFWGALPHQVQGAVVVFGTAALTAFVDAAGAENLSFAQLKHSAAVGVASGLIALKAFFSLASNAQEKLDKANAADEVKP